MTSTALPYFVYAFGILLREGLEALLVVVALAAGVRQMGRAERVREIYIGAGIAVVASLLLAWGVNELISDNASDTLEGVFQLFAAATLFYVSSWLTAKTQAAQWQEFLVGRLQDTGRRAVPLAFGATAFLAVLREGAETIVFFQALIGGASAGAERHAIMAGMGAATIALAVIFLSLRGVLLRIPLRHFFGVTSILLYALAIVFVGQSIGSLQEANVVGANFVPYVPTIPTLGLFPTVQSIVAQALLLGLALAAWFVVPMRKAAAKPLATAQPEHPGNAVTAR